MLQNIYILSLVQTLLIALLSSFLSTLLGSVLGIVNSFFCSRFHSLFHIFILLSVAISPFILAFCYHDWLMPLVVRDSPIFSLFSYFSQKTLLSSNVIYACFIFTFSFYPYSYFLVYNQCFRIRRDYSFLSKQLDWTIGYFLLKAVVPLLKKTIIISFGIVFFEVFSDYAVAKYLNIKTLPVEIIINWSLSGNIKNVLFFIVLVTIPCFFISIIFSTIYIETKNESYYENSKTQNKSCNIGTEVLSSLLNITVLSLSFFLPLARTIFLCLVYSPSYSIWSACAGTIFISTFISLTVCIVIRSIFMIYKINFTSFLSFFLTAYSLPSVFFVVISIIILTNLQVTIPTFLIFFMCLSLKFACVPFVHFLVSERTIGKRMKDLTKSLALSKRTYLKYVFNKISYSPFVYSFIIVFLETAREIPITTILKPMWLKTISSEIFLYSADERFGESCHLLLSLLLISFVMSFLLVKNVEKKSKI